METDLTKPLNEQTLFVAYVPEDAAIAQRFIRLIRQKGFIRCIDSTSPAQSLAEKNEMKETDHEEDEEGGGGEFDIGGFLFNSGNSLSLSQSQSNLTLSSSGTIESVSAAARHCFAILVVLSAASATSSAVRDYIALAENNNKPIYALQVTP
jgi:hypothetical protein